MITDQTGLADKNRYGISDPDDPNSIVQGSGDSTFGITYGGDSPYNADMLSNGLQQMTGQALGHQAPVLDQSQANASLANAAAMNQADAVTRGAQLSNIGQLRAQAMGAAPSAANIQAGINSGAATQSALSSLASGRTQGQTSSLATAALANNAQGQLQNQQQFGQNRLQELGAARQAYGGAADSLRSSDYGMATGNLNVANSYEQMANQRNALNLNQYNQNQALAQQYQAQRNQLANTIVGGEKSAMGRSASEFSAQVALDQAKRQGEMGLLGAATGAGGSVAAGLATTSDERAKEPAWDVAPLYEPEGSQLHQSVDGHAFYQDNPQEQTIGGGMPVPSLASAAQARAPEKLQQMAAHPTQKREMSYDELMAAADKEIAAVNADSARRQAGPSAVDAGVLADANRKMAGQPYRYKPEFVPPDEVPGQVHHGFMAQNLEQNPVTATAVVEGPDGVKQVHGARMMQAMASGLSDLQRQVDETRAALAKGSR